jgi:long-chain acyl-CoA synthetase
VTQGEFSIWGYASQRAKAVPDAPVLWDEDRILSYGGLCNAALRLSARLRKMGVQGADRVAIVLPTGSAYLIAFFAVMHVGAIVVPLSSVAKRREYSKWFDDCQPVVVIAEIHNQEVHQALMSGGPRISVLSADSDFHDPFLLENSSLTGEEDEFVKFPEQAPACILYTSGSTGDPKGVTLSHRNLTSNALAIAEYLALTADDRVVTALPPNYAYGNSLITSHVVSGAALVVVRNMAFPQVVLQAVQARRATGLSGVPSMFSMLLARTGLSEFELTSLRYVTLAGGAMPALQMQALREQLSHTSLFVMYGQTEATARLTYLPPERLVDKVGSVGIPIRDVQIQIRDEHGNHIPVGETGEVWASGPNIMLGYWGNEQATRKALSEGWLKTGDLGRVDAEGYLYIIGRRSDMIKVGGHRVSPAEIEEVLHACPGVQEAAVVGADDRLLGQVIHASVVLEVDAAIGTLQIQEFCRANMALYKVPKLIEIVSSLPKTENGKLLRRSLLNREQV